MSEQRSQIILINSTNRVTGTPYDFNLVFGDGLIHAAPGNTLRMVVIDACLNRSWYTINAGDNTFTLVAIVGTTSTYITITIPVGYYDVYSMRSTLLALLNAASQTSYWSITYSAITSTYVYGYTQGPATTGFYFRFGSNRCSEFMGFGPFVGTTGYISFTSTLTGVAPIKMNLENSVLVHCDVAKRPCSSLDNTNTTVFVESDVILKMCNSCAPFDNMIYQSQGNDNFNYDLAVTDITALHIYVTDENNRSLQLNFDWTITLKLIEVAGDDERMLGIVREIKDYLNLIVLDKHMGK